MTNPSKNAHWTGERLETFIFNETMIEHLHRYAFAMEWVAGAKVLDIASGEGYGSHLLAQNAQSVVGIDLDGATIENAKRKYIKDNLTFFQGNTSNIPCPDASFDVVVSFETIEHHAEHEKMMSEIKRVLQPSGILILSTPDKKYYSDLPNYKNPFHVKELYENELQSLVKGYFNHAYFLYQQAVFGSIITSDRSREWKLYHGDYSQISSTPLQNGLYIIAVASDKDLHQYSFPNSCWTDKNLIAQNISDQVTRSLRYRVGDFLIAPLAWVKKKLNPRLRKNNNR